MKNIKNALFTALLGTVLIATGCRKHEEHLNGRDQAKRDLGKGILRVAIEDGTNMPAFGEYATLLRSRYNIGWITYSAPANRDAAAAWVRGYNEVALPRIELQFGPGVLTKTMTDAEKLHAQSLK